jgi:hypothetical protein
MPFLKVYSVGVEVVKPIGEEKGKGQLRTLTKAESLI